MSCWMMFFVWRAVSTPPVVFGWHQLNMIWYVMDARDGTRMGSPTNNREQQNVCVQWWCLWSVWLSVGSTGGWRWLLAIERRVADAIEGLSAWLWSVLLRCSGDRGGETNRNDDCFDKCYRASPQSSSRHIIIIIRDHHPLAVYIFCARSISKIQGKRRRWF